jgi:hypothetical protein
MTEANKLRLIALLIVITFWAAVARCTYEVLQ